MPRRKRTTNQKQAQTLQKDDTTHSTIRNMNSNMMDNFDLKLVMWREDVKDRMKDAYRKLEDMKKEKLAMFELKFKNCIMAIPRNFLNAVIDIDNEDFRSEFLSIFNKTDDESTSLDAKPGNDDLDKTLSPPPRTIIRRRSRSAGIMKASYASVKKTYGLRSSSVDMYKTPKGRVGLSSIMTNVKYTVMKPKKKEDSGIHVKRIMKPNEEAISTCGSPLFVGACSVNAPHVNIPLPGGVILNIEPKVPKEPVEVPGLDPETRNQIKILCEQLKKLY